MAFDAEPNALTPQPIVTIMVESPHEPPNSDFSIDMRNISESDDGNGANNSPVQSTTIDIDDPIDVNVPRDTTNIFYDYVEPTTTTPPSPSTNNLSDLQDQQHIDVIKSDSDATEPDSELGLTS